MTNKTVKNLFPIILSTILVVAAGVAVWQMMKAEQVPAENAQSQPVSGGAGVINLNAPLEKEKDDELNKIQIASGGGTKEMMQIKFSYKLGDYNYTDALVMTPEEYAKLTPDQITQMEKDRALNWAKTVNEQSSKPN